MRSPLRSAIEWRDIVPGAQTERRGGAAPVGGLLGGKDPTGRFASSMFSGPQPVAENPISFNSGPPTTDHSHQFPFEPSTSPPLGVNAAHQMVRLMPGDSVRTLPSA